MWRRETAGVALHLHFLTNQLPLDARTHHVQFLVDWRFGAAFSCILPLVP